jgi:glycosyltransferase involved in cell wall biosynthesis
MTGHLLDAVDELGLLSGHLDTRNPQPIEAIGALSVPDIFLGLRHALKLHRMLRHTQATDVLLPISQGRWGFLRDVVLVLVVRAHRRRLILHLHGGGLDAFYAASGQIMRRVIRSVFRQADAAWALTSGLERMFEGLVSPSRVAHVENVTPAPPGCDGDGQRQGAASESPFHVLYLANLVPEKGVFDLLDALHMIGSDASYWWVRIVGVGSNDVIEAVRSKIDAIGDAGARVEVIPGLYGDEKWAAYRAADVFVFPTAYPLEGQPLVLLEAMAAGLPIVSTPQGGIPETARHEREALLVPQRDVGGLAAALLRLASDADLRASLARAARERYTQRYRPERLRRDLQALLGSRVSTASLRPSTCEIAPR